MHERNIINVTKDQTLKIIDFDLSSWGYRAYDLCYFFVHMPKWPSWTSIDLFLDAYLDIYNSLADIESGKDMLIQEIQYHMPFVLLGKMLLDESINQSVKASHIDAYFTAMSKNHNQLILHFTWWFKHYSIGSEKRSPSYAFSGPKTVIVFNNRFNNTSINFSNLQI